MLEGLGNIYLLGLKTEAPSFSETLILSYQTARCYTPEEFKNLNFQEKWWREQVSLELKYLRRHRPNDLLSKESSLAGLGNLYLKRRRFIRNVGINQPHGVRSQNTTALIIIVLIPCLLINSTVTSNKTP
jgi:hypothetical protein